WKRERSGRWKVSAAAGCSALTPVQQSDNETALQSVPGLSRRTRWQWGLGMRAFPGTLRATPIPRSPRRGLREPSKTVPVAHCPALERLGSGRGELHRAIGAPPCRDRDGAQALRALPSRLWWWFRRLQARQHAADRQNDDEIHDGSRDQEREDVVEDVTPQEGPSAYCREVWSTAGQGDQRRDQVLH